MHEILYFVHVSAMALWLGSLVALAWWSKSALQAPDAGSRSWALATVNRLTMRVAVPASVLVLLAGLSMQAAAGSGAGAPRPLWLRLMEDGGGMLILASLFVVPWLSRRIRRAAEDKLAVQRAVRGYVAGMAVLAAGVAGVLLAVSLRLA